MHRSARALVALAATAGALAASPAYAAPPTTVIEVRHIHVPIANCGSFTLIIDSTVNRELTTFYGAGGLPTRDVLVRRQEGSFINANTGASVSFTGNWRNVHFYTDGVPNGVDTQTGRTYTITLPGRGVIFLQAGHGVQVDMQTVFEAGPHDFEERDFDEVCDYLAD
jgi:hypothetical protein